VRTEPGNRALDRDCLPLPLSKDCRMSDSNEIFNYLAVLFSIILGLAVTEVLQGFRRLLLLRRRVVVYWPSILWAFNLLVICAQTWWTMFGLRDETGWTFGMYAIVLVQTALLYLVAGLSLSGMDEESGYDMRRAYFDNARPFFLLLVGLVAASLIKDVIINGHLPDATNLVFHAVFALCATIAAATRNETYHKINAPAVALALGAYVVMLFDHIS
ncbi:MAG TPA: hypothetical protein PLR28_00275, partial [Dokdonella sp.]|uniref:hypothetical protein n=2 Tax=Dokdonella sp. TaxID=2291710 RepID=UPI002C7121F4